MSNMETSRWVIATSISVMIAVCGGIFSHMSVISDLKSRVSVLESVQAIQIENMSKDIAEIQATLKILSHEIKSISNRNDNF